LTPAPSPSFHVSWMSNKDELLRFATYTSMTQVVKAIQKVKICADRIVIEKESYD